MQLQFEKIPLKNKPGEFNPYYIKAETERTIKNSRGDHIKLIYTVSKAINLGSVTYTAWTTRLNPDIPNQIGGPFSNAQLAKDCCQDHFNNLP